ncbi:rab11 family-interacting protein 5 [Tautogolabrus adspersus]
MSSLTVEEDQKWVPTHVQVTVLRGRGLRGKGKHGTSDVYTIIQLGKEKYSTGVVEKTTEPEWREECSFELQPGVLENGGRSGYPAGSNELVLTVMHRALIGLDIFLGQAVIQLDKVFYETRYVRNEWYRLNSKTGKKEKERGDIQVTVQFTRNNLTASMYDLVMKEKSASTFGKLKERMRGKKRSSDDDSSSAVLPSGPGSLQKIRQRLPSDGGGEEDYEDDEGGEARRSKMRTFFLRGKLRKSSDTRSSTSLGSESSESSSRGGSLSPTAGISVVVSDLSNSPSNSSNLTVDNSPEHTSNTSPRSCSLQCEFGDEAGEITIAVPQQTVCVNGSHAYDVQPLDPGSGKPVDSLGLGLLQKSLPVSVSLQNLSPHTLTAHPKSPVGDGRRWSFDKPGEEEKAAIVAALEKSGPMLADEDERLGQVVSSSLSTAALESQGKKQRRNLFSHGRSESAGKGQSQSKDKPEQATEEKHGGWFGSKDSHSKPSPHPVKPLTTAMLAEEKRTEGRSVLATGLEKLKSTIHPGRSSQISEPETERKKSLTEGAGSYYHLTHNELVALLVQRETDLERQKAEFERQKFLLAKRELELKKLKPQVRDLEDYIDTLLVRIMEQKPTLLQVRSKLK